MRACLADFPVFTPRSLEEALDALQAEPMVPLAGGTDLMVYLEAGTLEPCTFLNLARIPEFERRIDWDPSGGVVLGPLCSYLDVRSAPRLTQRYPMLARAAREVGAPTVQSRGTWSGNIVNASPAADGVPALMAYDATLELASRGGRRRLALADFYTGYKTMRREPGELLAAIHLPPPGRGWVEYYRKVGTRRFQAISKTLLAARVLVEDGCVKDVRLVLASVAPHTLRARETEAVLRGAPLERDSIERAVGTLEEEIRPIDDLRSTVRYRRRVSGNLLRECLERLLP